MSTVPEAIQARALGLEVVGLSILTNWAAGLGQESLNHAEVVETGRSVIGEVSQLLSTAISDLSGN
jgi:purine-nucleoside phosphorylase